MISLNKFFAITYIATIVSLGVIKAEYTTTEQVSELKQYLNKAKEFVTNIDTEEIKEKLSIAEQCAQKAFTAYPTVNVAAGMFFVGKALTNYQKANNASKYFDKEGTQQLKDTFVRSCNKAGKRNARIGAILLVGDIYYNRIQKEAIIENNQKEIQQNQTDAVEKKDGIQA